MIFSKLYHLFYLWDGISCGFVGWADPERPLQLRHALSTLRGMYENNNNARIQEKIQNFELVQNLIEEEK
jgi:hypothetical protein